MEPMVCSWPHGSGRRTRTSGRRQNGNPQCAFGGDLVRVQAQDGRICTGEVDAETDENVLWLRLTAPSIVVKCGIRWSMISKVSHADRQLSAAEFRPVAEKLKSAVPEDIFSPKAKDRVGTPDVESNRGKTVPSRRVQSIRIEAVAANWDADVELDLLLKLLDLKSPSPPYSNQLKNRIVQASKLELVLRRSPEEQERHGREADSRIVAEQFGKLLLQIAKVF